MNHLSDWLRLWHIPGVGPRAFRYLLVHFNNNPTEVFQSSHQELIACGIPRHIANKLHAHHCRKYENDLAWQQACNQHHIIVQTDPLYPQLLWEIPDAPPILYVIGDPTVFSQGPCIALIGGRKASSLGKSLAFEFAQQLAALGITVVSGLAYGIDGQAHRGALTTGKTIAVLANGLTTIYPPQHRHLSQLITEKGLLISEFPPGIKPLPKHFPRRNRIISGLSVGTIVIEAAAKSGSLITAQFALEQGREVFAVPGPVNNPLNAGCHALIQEGAKLTGCIDDIVDELGKLPLATAAFSPSTKNNHSLTSASLSLLEFIEYTPMSIEILIKKSGLTPAEVSSMLVELEMGRHVICDAYGLYTRSSMDINK